jgi:caffeoyl-CoA O-methyltransferase
LRKFTIENAVAESEHQIRLREETALHPQSEMQISPIQGALMGVLVRAFQATKILEIGTFTGYSALVMAEAMGPEGKLITCDISDEHTAVARRYWKEAGVDDRIELRLGDAIDTLDSLLESGMKSSFDLAFIDADKEQYPEYFERVLKLLRSGGLMLLDNMFMDGRVIDPANKEEGVKAIKTLWPKLQSDHRVDFTVVPVADGLGMAMKR